MDQITRPLILVVDDEAIVREVLVRFAEHFGYQVVSAASGTEAVERCRERRPALVILDVRMPELDGPETLTALRAIAPGLPCVFVSGDSRPYSIPDLLAYGDAAFLDKPVGMAHLRSAIERLLPTPPQPT